jgi:hypothetical protein
MELRSVLTASPTLLELPDHMLVSWFASKLRSLPLCARCTLAGPDLFRLFIDILAQIPPPPLVDAICLAMDVTLRHSEKIYTDRGLIVAENVNSEHLKQVCTKELGIVVCNLLRLGIDYASPDLFKILRYFVETPEFDAVCTPDVTNVIHLCDADPAGVVRFAAQKLHAARLMNDYAALSFPKPPFPLAEECL